MANVREGGALGARAGLACLDGWVSVPIAAHEQRLGHALQGKLRDENPKSGISRNLGRFSEW